MDGIERQALDDIAAGEARRDAELEAARRERMGDIGERLAATVLLLREDVARLEAEVLAKEAALRTEHDLRLKAEANAKALFKQLFPDGARTNPLAAPPPRPEQLDDTIEITEKDLQ